MPDDPRRARDEKRPVPPLRLTPHSASESKRPSKPGKPAKPRGDSRESHDELLGAFETLSRRINDLARELKCLGYFDDKDDRPRAA